MREIFKGDHNAAAARKPSMKTNKRPFSKGRLIISPHANIILNNGDKVNNSS